MPAQYATLPAYRPLEIHAAQATAAPVLALVSTTSSTAVAAPGSATVVVGNSSYISPGMWLAIYGGVGTAEVAQVTAVNGTSVTATFANTHSGTYNVSSVRSAVWGRIFTGDPGTTSVLTLYNGNPDITGGANFPGGSVPADWGSVLSTFKPAAAGDRGQPDVLARYGLWYKYSAGAAGSITLGVAPLPQDVN